MNICIYHKNCADGFGAAWAARKYFKENNLEYILHPGVYNEAPPDVTGVDVFLVDFSYKKEIIDVMLATAKSITILDHHESAIKDLSALRHPNLFQLFDKARSGAVITWLYFYPNAPIPQILLHIEDRDLWHFDLPGTKEILAAIYSYPFDFLIWDSFINAQDTHELRKMGQHILRSHDALVTKVVAQEHRTMFIGGYHVPVCNAGMNLASDVGHSLCQNQPFAAIYSDSATHRMFSLRSADDGLDVSVIATSYGGGGHVHAAGFRTPFSQLVIEGLL